MRIAGLIGAALCALAAMPASAATFTSVGVSGTVAGTTTTTMCNSGSALSCYTTYPGGTVSSPFTQSFTLDLGPRELAEGDTRFTFGGVFTNVGFWEGIITNRGGLLTGRDLQFTIADSSCRTGQIGCRSTFATASSFNVSAAVPEPGTWALMLLGFLAIGSALRQQPRQALARA